MFMTFITAGFFIIRSPIFSRKSPNVFDNCAVAPPNVLMAPLAAPPNLLLIPARALENVSALVAPFSIIRPKRLNDPISPAAAFPTKVAAVVRSIPSAEAKSALA